MVLPDPSSPQASPDWLEMRPEIWSIVALQLDVQTFRAILQTSKLLSASIQEAAVMSPWLLRAYGQRALAVAARSNSIETCHRLLHLGLRADFNDSLALHEAAVSGHFTICQLLLGPEAGDHPACASALDNTALACAAVGGHPQVCRLLMQHGAEADGWAVAVLGALGEANLIEVCEVIMGSGPMARQHCKSLQRRHSSYSDPGSDLVSSVLIEAAKQGNLPLCRALLQRAPTSSGDICAITHAAGRGNVDLLRLFLKYRRREQLDLNLALGPAAAAGQLEVLQLLLSHPPFDPYYINNAMRRALTADHLDAACVLLECCPCTWPQLSFDLRSATLGTLMYDQVCMLLEAQEAQLSGPTELCPAGSPCSRPNAARTSTGEGKASSACHGLPASWAHGMCVMM
mmetsp:Transcript_37516/g.83500  ORF Transcript_37516/g.83500 Transcript_37516/m.83500 type:complete len:402 (+) Transcript_37516:243-1448(+)|eukprot:CAMPEP_0202924202 /NCGR_PEP_ID=MMETSP1392-20130828/78849_1 /ASSEMBLY_ACC=CAM_ASM_000868 /TAXON_ID=225041 /ORGANISM="Chlamydomonas chlamydogama, Strain SAG 11-48b" /LENGTH=401 /DNA_ID=CAMNT_0049617919 /DNA_START=186 /DNA_END=1391 /DNA_ORIENTATION=+